MIGVFDSGSGGLTVMRALVDRFPDLPFLYLGDHAHTPYGMKSAEDVLELTIRNVDRLFAMDCRLVILACNTAAATSLRPMQQGWLKDNFPDRRVLGVLVPMVEAVTKVAWQFKEPMVPALPRPETVGIFATPRTVASGSYVREINLRAPEIEVYQQACPGLVELIEEDVSHLTIRTLIGEYAEAMKTSAHGCMPEVVILGCTHYPLIESDFRAVLPGETQVYSQSAIVAESLADYLKRHPEFSPKNRETNAASGSERSNETQKANHFLTTGNPKIVNIQASRFFGAAITFEALEGSDAVH